MQESKKRKREEDNSWAELFNAFSLKTGDKFKNYIKSELEKGSDPNSKDNLGRTAFYVYCCTPEPEVDIINLFLAKNTDPHITDNTGKTVLHCYCSLGNLKVDIIQALLKAGIDLNSKDNLGRTAFYVYCCKPEPEVDIINLFLAKNAGPHITDNTGKTVLHCYCSIGNLKADIIQALLKAGIDPNSKDNKQKTAVEYYSANKSLHNNDEEFFKIALLFYETGIDFSSLKIYKKFIEKYKACAFINYIQNSKPENGDLSPPGFNKWLEKDIPSLYSLSMFSKKEKIYSLLLSFKVYNEKQQNSIFKIPKPIREIIIKNLIEPIDYLQHLSKEDFNNLPRP